MTSAENPVKTGNPKRLPVRGYDQSYNPQKKTRLLLGQVKEVLEEYRDHLPLTARQVYYLLVAKFGFPKDEKACKALYAHLASARRAKWIKFSDLRDDGVSTIHSLHFDSAADFMDDAVRRARRYRRNVQQGQPCFIELWSEAAGMLPQLDKVAQRYSVPVYSAGGFLSVTATWEIAQRALGRDVPTVILHVGDLDPSGDSVFRALSEDVAAFVRHDDPYLDVIASRVALTDEHVKFYNLPTTPPKKSDTRAAAWGLNRGTCQLEALAPDVLAEMIDKEIRNLMRSDLLERHRAAELDECQELAGRLLMAGAAS